VRTAVVLPPVVAPQRHDGLGHCVFIGGFQCPACHGQRLDQMHRASRTAFLSHGPIDIAELGIKADDAVTKNNSQVHRTTTPPSDLHVGSQGNDLSCL